MSKSYMRKFHLQKKMLTITLTQAQAASGLPEVQSHQANFNEYTGSSFSCMEDLRVYLSQGSGPKQGKDPGDDLGN